MSCEREACVTVVTINERYRTVRTVRSRSWRMGLAFIPIRLSGRVAGERRRRASTHLQWRDVPVIKTDVMIERVVTVSFTSCDFNPVPLILTASQHSRPDTSEPWPIVSILEACYSRIASSRFGTVLLILVKNWRADPGGASSAHLFFRSTWVLVEPPFSRLVRTVATMLASVMCVPKTIPTVARTSYSSTIAGSSLHCLASDRRSRKLDS